MGKYNALWMALLGAAAVAITSALTDGVTTEEWIQVVIQVATAATVWLAANTPGLRWAKAAAAGLLAAANLALTIITDGIDASEARNLAIAFLVTLVLTFVRGPQPGLEPRRSPGGSAGVPLR